MILSASYDEISRLISRQSGQQVTFQYKNPDTLTVSYVASIPMPVVSRPLTHTVTFDVTLEELALPRVVLRFDGGRMGGKVFEMGLQKVLAKLPAGVVERVEGGRVVLNLQAVPQMQSRIAQLRVNSLSFYSTSFSLDADVR